MTIKSYLTSKEFINNPKYILAGDIIRAILVIVCTLVLLTLISNIKEVHLLNSDVCKLCMNKTGATCYLGDYNTNPIIVQYNYPTLDINVSEWKINITDE